MVELERQNMKTNKKIYNKALRELKKSLGKNIKIDHVGSTALPNMYGKNIIDILVGANDMDEMDLLFKKICELGYFPGSHSTGAYRFFASRKEETRAGDVHIHLVIMDSDRYKDFLTLRDYLLKNKKERKEYSDLKKKLITDGYSVREDYKKTKSEYVSALLERARKDSNK